MARPRGESFGGGPIAAPARPSALMVARSTRVPREKGDIMQTTWKLIKFFARWIVAFAAI